MSDRSDALNATVTTVPWVFVGDNAPRVFMRRPVSNVFVCDTTLAGTIFRLAVPANETISGSDMVGVDCHGGATGKRCGVYQGSSRPELDDAAYDSGLARRCTSQRCNLPARDPLSRLSIHSRFRAGGLSLVYAGGRRLRGYRYSRPLDIW
jgi:hypothetical protein